jgi:hypothetical protein
MYININIHMCIYPNCKTRPHYNVEGEKKALYCVTHKLDGMIDVKNKTCIHPNCKTRPVFNVEGQTRALYCSQHKKEEMVDVIHKTCIHPNCKTIPIYNIECDTIALYCFTHKLDSMVNVKCATCIHPNCKVQPIYNVEGQTRALYCSQHKKEEMVNVKSKTCIHPNCKTRPIYNLEGDTTGLYCSQHKLDGMIDVNNKTCIHEGCKIRPHYNVEGQTRALYCATHKLDGMINASHKTCKNEWCFTVVAEKYDGYCMYCYMNMFPDKPVSRNYKTKEYAVVEYVKNKFPTFDWVTDKQISGGCSKRRPDLLLDLGYQIIIIEIDENQHTDYDCSCENKRIMELSQDVGHRPIVFIRFNPDEYEKNEEKITSCWGLNKTGICVVRKTKQDEWNERLSCLEKALLYWSNPENTTNKTIEAIHLFYDE